MAEEECSPSSSGPSWLSCPSPSSSSSCSPLALLSSILFFPHPSASSSSPLHSHPGYLCLPYQLRFFHKHVLHSRAVLSVYYLCYLLLILGFIALIAVESSALFQGDSSSFYSSYFIFQTTVVLALFPYLIHFLNDTLSSDDLPLMIVEVMRYDRRFQQRILLLSFLNSFGFLVSLLIYGASVLGDPYRRAVEIFFFLVVLFPLPMCITATLILMDCHRRLADRFIEFLKYPTTSSLLETADNSPASSARTNSQLPFSNGSKLFDLSTPLLSLPFSLSSHIYFIHSQYLTLRDGYLFTSVHRGTFISLLSLNSLLLMVYLLWTVYLYSFSFFSIAGFIIIDFVILVEVFVWTSLANESGHLVSEALADHSLRLITQDGISAEQVQLLHHLISCLPYSRLEVYGIGKITVRFKLAATITIGFAAAIIPKLVLDQ